ncbi:MAG TPA: hypothetical protein PLP06_12645 [Saprospiraceae bacterium]|nr:hypothetical protein [Saprospiraceae bacterium]
MRDSNEHSEKLLAIKWIARPRPGEGTPKNYTAEVALTKQSIPKTKQLSVRSHQFLNETDAK